MKYVEIKDLTETASANLPKGLYFQNNVLWVSQGNGAFPISIVVGSLDIKTINENQGGNVSERFVLQLLAIGNKPNSVHDILKKG